MIPPRRGASVAAALVGWLVLAALATLVAAGQEPNQSESILLLMRMRMMAAADALIYEKLYFPEQWRVTREVTGLDARQTALARANELLDGARSPNPLIRAAFLRALGRLETPADVPAILSFLGDRAEGVRLEAANALAQVLHDPDAEAYGKWSPIATEAIRAFLPNEQDGNVHGMMLRALGEIRHDPGRASEILALLLRSAQVTLPVTSSLAARQLGAIEGIEALVRHHPDVRIDPVTRRAIRRLAVPSFGFEGDTGPFLPALQALVMLRDEDVSTVLAASMFRCTQARRWSADARRPDCGWEVRRLGLQLMRGVPEHSVLRQASKDPSFRVRMEAMRVYAREVPVSQVCQPVLDFLLDESPFVVMDALTKLDEQCLDRDMVVDRVQRIADDLADPLKFAAWHIPAVALDTLARFEPGAARKLATEHGLTHPIWQVRMAVARVAAALEDERLAFQLAYDDEPNVRAEALSTLYRLKSSATGIVAIDALSARGKYRPNSLVVYTAALVLRGSPAGAAAVAPLLQRLVSTAGSREARLEIVKRLSEFAEPEEKLVAQLKRLFEPPPRRFLTVHEVSEEPETEDQRDPPVTRALADLIGKLTGARPNVPVSAVGTRPPSIGQPCFYLETELVTSRIGILANRLEAPITTALFNRMALDGKFDGTTFHRVFPNNYIQGGSPRANDYSDPAPDVRAEVGPLRHTRGSVAIMHRERHAGHMQLLINLVDAPYLNRDFTVFGQVGRCQLTDPDPAVMMDAVDRLMEGAKIVKIHPYVRLR